MIAICRNVKPRVKQSQSASVRGAKPSKSIKQLKQTAKKPDPERTAALKRLKIEYIENVSFKKRSGDEGLLSGEVASIREVGVKRDDSSATRVSKNLPAYLARMYETRLLNREEEAGLFRRMNYLKYRADRLRKRLSSTTAKLAEVERIESLLAEADSIKSMIVRANLRLVISIAKRFVDPMNNFDDLVSDGNLSLIRAVEKFDYNLGNRFSTYATYAIRRNFYRTIIQRRQQRGRFIADDDQLKQAAEDVPTGSFSTQQVVVLQDSLSKILDQLTPREQQIIRERFGFGLSDPKTFKELGEQLGVCKERIRQIQARAMEKLRQFAEQAKLLTMVDEMALGTF